MPKLRRLSPATVRKLSVAATACLRLAYPAMRPKGMDKLKAARAATTALMALEGPIGAMSGCSPEQYDRERYIELRREIMERVGETIAQRIAETLGGRGYDQFRQVSTIFEHLKDDI